MWPSPSNTDCPLGARIRPTFPTEPKSPRAHRDDDTPTAHAYLPARRKRSPQMGPPNFTGRATEQAARLGARHRPRPRPRPREGGLQLPQLHNAPCHQRASASAGVVRRSCACARPFFSADAFKSRSLLPGMAPVFMPTELASMIPSSQLLYNIATRGQAARKRKKIKLNESRTSYIQINESGIYVSIYACCSFDGAFFWLL